MPHPNVPLHFSFFSDDKGNKNWIAIFLTTIAQNVVMLDDYGKLFDFSNPAQVNISGVKLGKTAILGSFSENKFYDTPDIKNQWDLQKNTDKNNKASYPWILVPTKESTDNLEEELADLGKIGGKNNKITIPFDKRKKSDLFALAKSRHLKVSSSMTKKCIIDLLRK